MFSYFKHNETFQEGGIRYWYRADFYIWFLKKWVPVLPVHTGSGIFQIKLFSQHCFPQFFFMNFRSFPVLVVIFFFASGFGSTLNLPDVLPFQISGVRSDIKKEAGYTGHRCFKT